MSRRQTLALFCFALPLLAAPWLSPWPTADLSNAFTDHLRHAFAAQVFLQRGVLLYTEPLGQAGEGVASQHPGYYWADVPYAYPPGALLLFLPLSTASEKWVASPELHARLLVTFTALLAVLSWLAIVRLLFTGPTAGLERALRLLVSAFAFGELMHQGLEGFYDPAWVGLGALAIDRLNRKQFSASIWFCVAAAFIHLRAVVLIPVAVVALKGLLDARGRRGWLHPAVASAVLVGGIDAAIFLAVLPFAGKFRIESKPLIAEGSFSLVACVAVTLFAVALCLWARQWLVAVTVVLVLGVALTDLRAWWHAGVALLVLLLASRPSDRARSAAVASLFLTIWAVQVQRFAWGGHPWDLPRKLAHALTAGAVARDP